jgi:lysophospholipase L1-like esterase
MSLTLKLALSPLLVAQALHVRRRVPRLPEASGVRAGEHGDGATRLRLLIAGDSSAAGVGVATQDDALVGQLLPLLSRSCAARVRWTLCARSGVTTAQTAQLLHESALPPSDLAIVVTGVNDVVDQVASSHAVRSREHIVDLLRNRVGVQHVVFCPVPPVHQFPALPQPLRWMAGTDAHRHNRALRQWVRERASGMGDVSTLALDHVHLNRDNMASDGFHPGAPVYRAVATALADHIARRVCPHLQLAAAESSSHGRDLRASHQEAV